jgi:formyltetrahydrofolate synthetase
VPLREQEELARGQVASAQKINNQEEKKTRERDSFIKKFETILQTFFHAERREFAKNAKKKFRFLEIQ